jgi:hypothetical protein
MGRMTMRSLLFPLLLLTACGSAPAGRHDNTGGGGEAGEGGSGEGGGGSGAGGSSGKGGSGGKGGTGGAPSAKDGGAVDAESSTDPDAGAPADTGSTTGPDGGSAIPASGLGAWTGKDNVPASTSPPGNLDPKKVPMFVSLGFDDNPVSEGVNWAVGAFSAITNPAGTGKAATYDGTPARATFYDSSTYAEAAGSWKAAYNAGFELGNHTIHHYHGASVDGGMNFTVAGWTTEIKGCTDFHTGAAVGMKRSDMWGFRTPFLQYNVNTFPAVKAQDFWYDCSIEEGHQEDQDGRNYWWPYTLDNGSPGNATHPRLTPIKSWPAGLWEMPAYRVIVPPDELAAKYGVPVGLRAKLMKLHPDGVGIKQGKITGLDYNLFEDYRLSKPEFLAAVKYTLDLRLEGNHAPMLLGMHTAIYTSQEPVYAASVAEKRAAIVEFLNYARSHAEVRIVTTKAVLDWIRNPVPLD